MRKVLEQCPSCGGNIEITRLNCTSCETIILGRYEPCPFCRLSPESTRFLETFVRCRGNVKEMERELGVESKPVEETDVAARQLEVLEQVDRGEISAAEASEILAQLNGADVHT
jgi:hypothetical protein